MKKHNTKENTVLIFIALAMILFGIGFCLYAITHPSVSFGWSNAVTYSIYIIYILIILILVFFGAKGKQK